MYAQRVKLFVVLGLAMLAACVLRLAQMQLLPDPKLAGQILELQQQRGGSRTLQTIRGRILDRHGRVLATDEPLFRVYVTYQLTQYLDDRIRQILRQKALKETNPDKALAKVNQAIDANLAAIDEVLEKGTQFGASKEAVEAQMAKLNRGIWYQRVFQAWSRNCPNSPLAQSHQDDITAVRYSDAEQDLAQQVPDPNKRLDLIATIDLREMHEDRPLLDLKDDDQVLEAQLAFADIQAVTVSIEPVRSYPYGSVAAQTLGWVGPARGQDQDLFKSDPNARYLDGDVCGREDGVEYVCEALLRGRRGRAVYDNDNNLIERMESRLGQDVVLSLDIELQKRIEDRLTAYPHDPNCGPGIAAVALDVGTGDLLAMVSLPTFDLNRVRYDYTEVRDTPGMPLINRVLKVQYPPGSVAKPLVLAAGLESGLVRSDEVIHCPSKPAPEGWPDCWIWRGNHIGHDDLWSNTARNALKGSCNIYFSHLAERFQSRLLQQWLFGFGYGRQIPLAHFDSLMSPAVNRDCRQDPGQISSIRVPYGLAIRSFDQIPKTLRTHDRILMGIGEGNFWATPLQVARSIAILARKGDWLQPRLFLQVGSTQLPPPPADGNDLGLSPGTLRTVYDGLRAVVNESQGTANTAFAGSGLAGQGVVVYGKTGSTERPYHAWFGGFAQDPKNRTIAVAVVVEGGQHGGSDAAPLGREIFRACVEAGYLGPGEPASAAATLSGSSPATVDRAGPSQ